MVWLRLFWWMVWRGVVRGAASGALFGTVLALILGTVFGFVFGAILGLATGIVNGLAVVTVTHFWFYPPENSPRYRKAIITTVAICTAITSLIVMNSLWFGVAILIILPTIYHCDSCIWSDGTAFPGLCRERILGTRTS